MYRGTFYETVKKFKQHGCVVNMFFDKNSGGEVEGIPVYNTDMINESDFDYIVIATANFRQEIKKELIACRIDENKIIDIYEVLKIVVMIFVLHFMNIKVVHMKYLLNFIMITLNLEIWMKNRRIYIIT